MLTWVLRLCRGLCRLGLPLLVSVWKNQSFWSPRTYCEALHCPPPITCCSSCRNLEGGWLLAPLAGCFCWWSSRFVLVQVTMDIKSSLENLKKKLKKIMNSISRCSADVSPGLVVASLCYLQFFPAPYHPEGAIFVLLIIFFFFSWALTCRFSSLLNIENPCN